MRRSIGFAILLRMSAWDVELLLARNSRDHRALARDRERKIVRKVRHGVYVLESDLAEASIEDKHIIAIRAAVVTTDRPLTRSHWSAAVVHGLSTLGDHLGTVHATFGDAGARGLEGVSSHLFQITDDELVEVNGLLVTAVGRTVVDVAGAGTFEEGVVTADAALAAGLPRESLELAVDLAGPRRAETRIKQVVEFADGDSGSAGESVSRVTMAGMGLQPELQHRFSDRRGYIGRSDFFFPEVRAAGEFDGRVKFVNTAFAPNGAAEMYWNEKVREDRIRAKSDGFARMGLGRRTRPPPAGPDPARRGSANTRNPGREPAADAVSSDKCASAPSSICEEWPHERGGRRAASQ